MVMNICINPNSSNTVTSPNEDGYAGHVPKSDYLIVEPQKHGLKSIHIT
jgi:hypothetical protein